MSDVKIVVAMRAVPGTGKSTLAEKFIQKAKSQGLTAERCSADDFFYMLGKGTYKFDPSKLGDAHGECFDKFSRAVDKGVNLIVVDNTNLELKFVEPYKKYAEANRYTFKVAEVVGDFEKAFQRQQHGVPEAGHKRMREAFVDEKVPSDWSKSTYEMDSDEDDYNKANKSLNELIKIADKFDKKLKK
jgi:hypothetical protein